jgi:endogenous inhibitor of DNA gyrase (YacG/DUF329 family)
MGRYIMGKIEIVCKNCKKTFLRYPSDVRDKNNSFCSIGCKREYSKKNLQEIRQCKQCGKEFSVYKSTVEKSNASGKFCCRSCYNDYLKTLVGEKNKSYNRMKKSCPVCGKTVYVTPSRAKTYKNKFCSIACRSQYMYEYIGGEKNTAWKGGTSRVRGNFEQVKKKYFSGTQFCAICGTSKKIHIHHIIPYRLTQDNSKSNLIPLCNRHHKVVESKTLKFIELFDAGTYSKAKDYLNIMLRGKQFETYGALKIMAREKMDGIAN